MNLYRENKYVYDSESSEEEESRDEVWFSRIARVGTLIDERNTSDFNGFNIVKITTSIFKIAKLNFQIETGENYPTVINCVGHIASGLAASQFHGEWKKSNLLHLEIFKAKNKNGFLFYSDNINCLTYRFYLTVHDALKIIDSIPCLVKSYERKVNEIRRRSGRFEKPVVVESVTYLNDNKNQYVKIFGTNYRDILIKYNYNASPGTFSTCFLTLESVLAFSDKKEEIIKFDKQCLDNQLKKCRSFSYEKLQSLIA